MVKLFFSAVDLLSPREIRGSTLQCFFIILAKQIFIQRTKKKCLRTQV